MKSALKNWKTSLAGILGFALFAGHYFYPAIFTPELTASIAGVLGSAGLIAAKDGTVTGIGASATSEAN